MKTIDAVRRNPVIVAPDMTVADSARVMADNAVGSVVVVDGDNLVGIVTDRDIVCRGLARDVPADARVDGLMSSPVVSIDADADVRSAFVLFRENGFRRLPVTRGAQVVGMISIDDLLINLSADLADLSRPVTAEAIFGQRDADPPATA